MISMLFLLNVLALARNPFFYIFNINLYVYFEFCIFFLFEKISKKKIIRKQFSYSLIKFIYYLIFENYFENKIINILKKIKPK